jgi:hypothetical protein
MTDIKLAKLPDKTLVKLTLSLSPQLHEDLVGYAAAYRDAYGQEEAISDLIPMMLAAFLNSDKAFRRSRRNAAERTK